MPIRPSFKIKLKNKTKSNDNLLIENNLRKRDKPKSSVLVRDKKERSHSRYTENLKKPGRKIIDMNYLSDQSILSSHFLNQPAQRLGDLKLNENWPSSEMYKVTIQSNPWVKSFKERSIANEINSSFRELSSDDLKKNPNLFSYLPARNENKQSATFFPNIKQIFS